MSFFQDSKPTLVSAFVLALTITTPRTSVAQQTAPTAPVSPAREAPADDPASPEPAPADAELRAAEVAPSDRPSPAAAPAQDEVEVNELGQVIVTARRRNEAVQDVPVAINVLSGDSLESKGAVGLQGFHREAASVTSYATNPRNATINIRGIGSNVAGSGVGFDAGVGFYVDDVYYNRLSTATLNLADVERIEILRGPQGTLFGRNTTAGALSVYTRAPTFSPDASLDVSAGNYSFLHVRGSLSGPIVEDKLAGRLSFEALSRNGFLINTNQLGRIHGQESFQLRGQLLYKASDRFKVRIIADFLKQATVCCITQNVGYVTAYDNGAPVNYPYLERLAELGYTPPPIDLRGRTVSTERNRPFRVTQGGTSVRADWDLGANTLTSISSARFWFTHPRNDSEETPLDIVREGNTDDRQWQASEEIRLTSNDEGPIDYVAGAFFYYQFLPTKSRTEYGPQAGEFYIAPGTNGLTPEQRRDALNGAFIFGEGQGKTISYAPFGQATWHALENLDLTGGVRYTYERKIGHYEQVQGNRYDASELNDAQIALRNSTAPVIPRYELDKTWHSISGLATASLKLAEDKIVYGTYSRGSKSGGLNISRVPPGVVEQGLAVVGPETVDHFEVGLKSQWLARRLTANVTLFHTTIDDYQNTYRDTGSTPARTYITNSGSVRSRGVEVELRVIPTKGLTLNASGTYVDAIYKDYENAPCPWEKRAPGQPSVCDLSGEQLPVAPKYSAAAGGSYTAPLSESLNGFVSVDYSYRSMYTTTANNSRHSRVPRTDLVNARAGVKDADGKWEVSVWSNNVFDELYFLSKAVDEQTGRVAALLGDPRTFGATFRYYFY